MGKKRSKYSLRDKPAARSRAYWLIRDYPRLKAERDALDGYSSGKAEGAGGRVPGSSVETQAIKRARLSDQLAPVERAIKTIPEEYRDGIWDAVIYKKLYPDTAGFDTWKRYRQQFVYMVALYAGYL